MLEVRTCAQEARRRSRQPADFGQPGSIGVCESQTARRAYGLDFDLRLLPHVLRCGASQDAAGVGSACRSSAAATATFARR